MPPVASEAAPRQEAPNRSAAGGALALKSARELAQLIRTRAVSPVEVLDAFLAVIEALNPKLNAIVTLAAEQARDAARLAESAVMKGDPLGPLHGLPIAVKDVTPTAGIRTTFASPLFKDYVPTEDAEAVRRLKAAGAIVLAKTNTPEFACGANTNNVLFGPTRNPWNPALSPAGSSGGSAVAVAAGMVPIAQGTDYGCSIRIPAAFCGIVGIRPTPGLTPSRPLHLPWDPGQVHGPMAHDAEDAALFLDAIVGFTRLSPISVAPPWQSALAELERRDDIKELRIAYVSDIAGIGVEAEIDTICRDAAAALGKLGAKVEHIEFDASGGRAAYQTWRGFWMVGQQYQRLAQIKEFGPNLRGNVEAGLKLTRARLRRGRAQARTNIPPLPQAVRPLRCLAHAGGAGEALSDRDEFPERDQRPQVRELHRLDRAGLSDHAGEPAGRDRAGRPVAGRAAGRHADRRAALRRAADPAGRADDPPSQQCRVAADQRTPSCPMPDEAQALWIKDPLAILADGAERGIVVKDGRIVELVAAGREPATADVKTFDAGEHVVLPGLINTHHHFYQTLTRAVPAALDRELFPWLQALYPIWARLTPEALDLGMTLAMAELMLSGCTTTTDHHYVFPRASKTASTSRSRRRGGSACACC